ncbi:MAG: glycoside hydrolase family 43 protein [Clostridia bacterium]|nr:glycoside hydrolase family 43 protein [Clostridia bacterium]MBQ8029906.1 glycoside hydrolase family 43 protein [Clostridia bacterium]
MNHNQEFAEPAVSKEGKYLFCYFTGNEPERERISFAVSEDGYNFKPLNNGQPVILQTKGKKCVRDPFIVKGKKGEYYIIGTDMKSSEGWVSNHALISWKSEDLVNWTDETVIDIRSFGGEFSNTNRAWAPEVIFDEEVGKFMVYWSHSTFENDVASIYYAYTDDFKTLTTPTPLYSRPGVQTIDADIAKNEKTGVFYLYFKYDETQKIAYVKSDKLTGPYKNEPVVVSLAPTGVEGSAIYNITGTDTWVLCMDEYGKDYYFAQQTTDFENFLPLRREDYQYSINPRHASVVAITDEEYNRLISHYGI